MHDNSDDRLDGKVAIVTGASYGIGRAISEALALKGAHVVLTDLVDKVAETAVKLQAAGLPVSAAQVDVRDKTSIRAMVERTLAAHGRIDILVNNAAAARFASPILEMPADAWDATMAVNLRGTLFCIQECGGAIVRGGRGGRIVNIASTAAIRPYKNRSHYCTSKAAIVALTKVAALELAEHRITVNCVAPGQTETENFQRLKEGFAGIDGEEVRQRAARIPLGVGNPADIAHAVAYFASARSGQATGQVLLVDGGTLLI